MSRREIRAAQRAYRAAQLAAERAAKAAAWLESAKSYLAGNRTGGKGLVALRSLEAGVRSLYVDNPDEVIAWALNGIQFDRAGVNSQRLGYVHTLTGSAVEVFKDYVIHGEDAYDVEPTTRGQVYVDGAIQITSRVVHDRKGRPQTVQDRYDLRTAQLQFTSASWSLSVSISPDNVSEARRIVDQLATHVAMAQPQQATVADVKAMVDAILNSSGQPPAEKLRQLSNLRYERLLTDDEFERAKTTILGI